MADKEPDSREEPLQLLPVDLVIDKDLAADLAGLHIDQTPPVTLFEYRHLRTFHLITMRLRHCWEFHSSDSSLVPRKRVFNAITATFELRCPARAVSAEIMASLA